MKIFNSSDLPEDVVFNASIIKIMSNKTIVIENFKKLIHYDDKILKIKTKNLIITIYGIKLVVNDYCNDEAKVSGVFNKIEFEAVNE